MSGRGFWRSLSHEREDRETYSSRQSMVSSSSYRYSSSESLFSYYRSIFNVPQKTLPFPSKNLNSSLLAYSKDTLSDIGANDASHHAFDTLDDTRSDISPVRRSYKYSDFKRNREATRSFRNAPVTSNVPGPSNNTCENKELSANKRSSPSRVLPSARDGESSIPGNKQVLRWLDGSSHFNSMKSTFTMSSTSSQLVKSSSSTHESKSCKSTSAVVSNKTSDSVEETLAKDLPPNYCSTTKFPKFYMQSNIETTESPKVESHPEKASKQLLPDIPTQMNSFSEYVIDSERRFEEFVKNAKKELHVRKSSSDSGSRASPARVINVPISIDGKKTSPSSSYSKLSTHHMSEYSKSLRNYSTAKKSEEKTSDQSNFSNLLVGKSSAKPGTARLTSREKSPSPEMKVTRDKRKSFSDDKSLPSEKNVKKIPMKSSIRKTSLTREKCTNMSKIYSPSREKSPSPEKHVKIGKSKFALRQKSPSPEKNTKKGKSKVPSEASTPMRRTSAHLIINSPPKKVPSGQTTKSKIGTVTQQKVLRENQTTKKKDHVQNILHSTLNKESKSRDGLSDAKTKKFSLETLSPVSLETTYRTELKLSPEDVTVLQIPMHPQTNGRDKLLGSPMEVDTIDSVRRDSLNTQHKIITTTTETSVTTRPKPVTLDGHLRHPVTGEPLSVAEAVAGGFLLLAKGLFVRHDTKEEFTLSEALEREYISKALYQQLQSPCDVVDTNTGKPLTVLEAAKVGIFCPEDGSFKDPKTGKLLTRDEASNLGSMLFKKVSDDSELRSTLAPSMTLYEAVNAGRLDIRTGEFTDVKTLEKYSLTQAFARGFLTCASRSFSLQSVTCLSDVIGSGAVDSAGMLTHDPKRGPVNLSSAIEEGSISTQILEVSDPATGLRVTLEKAGSSGIIDTTKNMYVYDISSPTMLSLRDAYQRRLIHRAYPLTECYDSNELSNDNMILNPSTKKYVTLLRGIGDAVIECDVKYIWDTESGFLLSLAEALASGVITPDGFYFNKKSATRITLIEAIEQGYIIHPGAETVFDIKGILDSENEKLVSVKSAIENGIFDVKSATFKDPSTGKRLTIEEALKKRIVQPHLVELLSTPIGMYENSGKELSILDSVVSGRLDLNTGKIVDPSTGFVMPLDTAISQGMITTEGGKKLSYLISVSTKTTTIVTKEIKYVTNDFKIAHEDITTVISKETGDKNLSGNLEPSHQPVKEFGSPTLEATDTGKDAKPEVLSKSPSVASTFENLIKSTSSGVESPTVTSDSTSPMKSTSFERETSSSISKSSDLDQLKSPEDSVDSALEGFDESDTTPAVSPIIMPHSLEKVEDLEFKGVPVGGWHLLEAIEKKLLDPTTGLFTIVGSDRPISFEKCIQIGLIDHSSIEVLDPESRTYIPIKRAFEMHIITATGQYVLSTTEYITLKHALVKRLVTVRSKFMTFDHSQILPIHKTEKEAEKESVTTDFPSDSKQLLAELIDKIHSKSDEVSVKDPVSGISISIAAATEKGIIDEKSGEYRDENGSKISVSDAVKLGLIGFGGALASPLIAVAVGAKAVKDAVSQKVSYESDSDRDRHLPRLASQVDYQSQLHDSSSYTLTTHEVEISSEVSPKTGEIVSEIKISYEDPSDLSSNVVSGTDACALQKHPYTKTEDPCVPTRGTDSSIEAETATEYSDDSSKDAVSVTTVVTEITVDQTPTSDSSDVRSRTTTRVVTETIIESEIIISDPYTGKEYPLSKALELGLISEEKYAEITTMVKAGKSCDDVPLAEEENEPGYLDVDSTISVSLPDGQTVDLAEGLRRNLIDSNLVRVVDSKSGSLLPFDVAVDRKIINVESTEYFHVSGKKIPVNVAAKMGLIVLDGAEGAHEFTIRDGPVVQQDGTRVDLDDAIKNKLLEPSTLTIVDPKTGKHLTFSEAVNAGVVDQSTVEYIDETGEHMPLKQAAELGYIGVTSVTITPVIADMSVSGVVSRAGDEDDSEQNVTSPEILPDRKSDDLVSPAVVKTYKTSEYVEDRTSSVISVSTVTKTVTVGETRYSVGREDETVSEFEQTGTISPVLKGTSTLEDTEPLDVQLIQQSSDNGSVPFNDGEIPGGFNVEQTNNDTPLLTSTGEIQTASSKKLQTSIREISIVSTEERDEERPLNTLDMKEGTIMLTDGRTVDLTEAVVENEIECKYLTIVHPNTREQLTFEEAVGCKVVDKRSGDYVDTSGKRVSLKDAAKMGLVGVAAVVGAPLIAGVVAAKAIKRAVDEKRIDTLDETLDVGGKFTASVTESAKAQKVAIDFDSAPAICDVKSALVTSDQIDSTTSPTAHTEMLSMTEEQKSRATEAPIAADEKAPIAADEKAPVAADEKAPVAADEKAPVAADEKAPVAADEKAPVAADEKAPVAADEKAPVAADEKAPIVADDKAVSPSEETKDETLPLTSTGVNVDHLDSAAREQDNKKLKSSESEDYERLDSSGPIMTFHREEAVIVTQDGSCLEVVDAISQGIVEPNLFTVVDPKTGTEVNMEQAIEKGVVDPNSGELVDPSGQKVSLKKAAKMGLIGVAAVLGSPLIAGVAAGKAIKDALENKKNKTPDKVSDVTENVRPFDDVDGKASEGAIQPVLGDEKASSIGSEQDVAKLKLLAGKNEPEVKDEKAPVAADEKAPVAADEKAQVAADEKAPVA
ncbi:Plectin repeat, partial [Trinorchestia longiramus]